MSNRARSTLSPRPTHHELEAIRERDRLLYNDAEMSHPQYDRRVLLRELDAVVRERDAAARRYDELLLSLTDDDDGDGDARQALDPADVDAIRYVEE